MSRLSRSKFIAVLLVLAILTPAGSALAGVGIRLAQADPTSSKKLAINTDIPTFNDGFIEGTRQAEVTKASKFGAGLLAGGLLGLVGTGVGYFMVGPKEIEGMVMSKIATKGEEYSLGFTKGWNEKTEKRKRSSFLKGGLLGTAAFVVLVVASQSGE